MKIMKKIPFIICVIMLIAVIAVSGNYNSDREISEEKTVTKTLSVNTEPKEEIRGLWVTYIDLDMRGEDMSEKSFKKKFRHIADTAKEKKFNTLIIQVRPFSDALYKSKYFPYSHILTGKQGKNPGYDPLEYMCAYTHKLGMKLHAWVNPYRVRSTPSLKLSSNNPYKKNPALGEKVGDGIFYNPCHKAVRTLIENGIREIVKNYEVDGIQFDDYFYPTHSKGFDSEYYREYVKSVGAGHAISLDRWRCAQVNILIAECRGIIHNTNKKAVFGISPQGNIENDYNMYADVKSWCSKYGYIDYICPQLYYSLQNPALKFEKALDNWSELEYHKSVELYIGIAGYKTGTDSDNGTWRLSDKILSKEVKLVRKKGLKGFMFYSYANLETEEAAAEVANLIKVLN